jgi:hypothetical protein
MAENLGEPLRCCWPSWIGFSTSNLSSLVDVLAAEEDNRPDGESVGGACSASLTGAALRTLLMIGVATVKRMKHEK